MLYVDPLFVPHQLAYVLNIPLHKINKILDNHNHPSSFWIKKSLPKALESGIIQSMEDLEILLSIKHENAEYFIKNNLPVAYKAGLIKSSKDLKILAKSLDHNYMAPEIISSALPIARKAGLIKSSKDLKILVNIKRSDADIIIRDILPAAYKSGLIKTRDDLQKTIKILTNQRDDGHFSISFNIMEHLPILINSGTIKSKRELKKIVTILFSIRSRQTSSILINALPKIFQSGLINYSFLELIIDRINNNKLDVNFFNLVEVYKTHPMAREYKQLMKKHNPTKQDYKRLQSILSNFNRLSSFVKKQKVDWTKHPNMNVLSVLKAKELLGNKDHSPKIDFSLARNPPKDKFKSVEINLRLQTGAELQIREKKEINYLTNLLKILKTTSGKKISLILSSFKKSNFKQPENLQGLLQKKQYKKIIAEYVRLNPKYAKSIIVSGIKYLKGDLDLVGKPNQLSTAEKIQEFFHDRVPEFLQEFNLQIQNPFQKELIQLKGIIQKAQKIRKEGYRKVKFRLSPGKTFLDNHPNLTGETCLKLKEHGIDIRDPKFHIIQIINTETGTNEGTIHLFERKVKGEGQEKKYFRMFGIPLFRRNILGENSFVLIGIEPKQRLVRNTKPTELYKALVQGLRKIAKQQNIEHIYSSNIHGEMSNRAEIDSRIKAEKLMKLKRVIRLHDETKHKELRHIQTGLKRK